MASFTKDVNQRLARCPLKTNRRLATRGLTSLVKEAIVLFRLQSRISVLIYQENPALLYFSLFHNSSIVSIRITLVLTFCRKGGMWLLSERCLIWFISMFILDIHHISRPSQLFITKRCQISK